MTGAELKRRLVDERLADLHRRQAEARCSGGVVIISEWERKLLIIEMSQEPNNIWFTGEVSDPHGLKQDNFAYRIHCRLHGAVEELRKRHFHVRPN